MFGLGKLGALGGMTLSKRAQAILRSFGTDASSYPFATRQGMFQDSAGTVPSLVVTDPIGKEADAIGTNHATQTTAGNRPLLAQDGNGRFYASFDGSNDSLATTTGGGASTAFFMCAAFQTAAAGVAQTLWSDRSGNTGLKLEITAGNVIQFSGGNGASINTATGDAVSTGTAYVVTAKYNGTNLSVQINNATAVTAACTLSAGTAAITIGSDPGGAGGFFSGGFYDIPYIKNNTPSAAQEAIIKSATGQRAGLVI